MVIYEVATKHPIKTIRVIADSFQKAHNTVQKRFGEVTGIKQIVVKVNPNACPYCGQEKKNDD